MMVRMKGKCADQGLGDTNIFVHAFLCLSRRVKMLEAGPSPPLPCSLGDNYHLSKLADSQHCVLGGGGGWVGGRELGAKLLTQHSSLLQSSEEPPSTVWSTDSTTGSSKRGLGPKQTKTSWLFFSFYLWNDLFCSSLENTAIFFTRSLTVTFITVEISVCWLCKREGERIEMLLYSIHLISRKCRYHCQPIKFRSFMRNSVMFCFCNCA